MATPLPSVASRSRETAATTAATARTPGASLGPILGPAWRGPGQDDTTVDMAARASSAVAVAARPAVRVEEASGRMASQ